MYIITICRRSKYLCPNKKGMFKKEFNTLNEIVKFVLKCNDNIWCPNIKKELTKREFAILLNKINSQLLIS